MKRVAIVGCPNAGKSSLVNSLTGSKLKVGNWHGVTVTREDRSYFYSGEEYVLSDLPGVYTLKSDLAEEGETLKALRKENYDAIILVADASALWRSLPLINECAGLNKPLALFINLYADFLHGGGKFSESAFYGSTGIPAFCGEANERAETDNFKRFLSEVLSKPPVSAKKISESGFSKLYSAPKKSKPLDDFFENPAICLSSFLLFAVFSAYLSFGQFGVGEYLSKAINAAIGALTRVLDGLLSGCCTPFIKDLLVEGLIGGVGAAAQFLPQVAIMSACLDVMEQSGLLARLAVISDGALAEAGLSGKAVYAMLCGYGCGAVAASVASGIEDSAVKKRVALSLPFTSCSAKTPVYAFVAKFCFREYAFIVIAGIYVFSALAPILHSALLYKTILKTPPAPLVFELASIRKIRVKEIVKSAFSAAENFILRLGTTIVIASLALFILSRVTVDLKYVTAADENSVVAYMGKAITPLFKPMGITDWRYAVAAVTGVFAKEGIVSALAALFPAGLDLTLAQGLAYSAFCYAYTPCVAALAATAKTAGKKYAAFSAVWQFALALVFAYLIYFIFG